MNDTLKARGVVEDNLFSTEHPLTRVIEHLLLGLLETGILTTAAEVNARREKLERAISTNDAAKDLAEAFWQLVAGERQAQRERN